MEKKVLPRDDISSAIMVYASCVNGSYEVLLSALKEFWWRFA